MARGIAKTFTLEIVPEHAPDVRRVVEVLQHSTLGELHRLIQHEFALDIDLDYSFFMTNLAWDDRGVFGSMAGDPTRTQLASLSLKPGREFLYIFDFEDELRHDITVKGTGIVEDGAEYPRVVESVGEPPPQYQDAPDLDEDFEPLAQEVAQAAGQWEQHDGQVPEDLIAGPPPRDVAIVQRDAALVRRLVPVLAGRGEQILAIAQAFNVAADEWFESVHFELADHGLMAEALELCTMLVDTFPQQEYLRHDRAIILARAGHRDEARQLIDARRASNPEDLDIMDQAADVLVLLGEDAEAEALSRQVREHAEGGLDGELIESATERLVMLLRKRGEEDEARKLFEELVDREEEDMALDADDPEFDEAELGGPVDADALRLGEIRPIEALPAPTGGVHRTGPKVGRNDPCPCGSGKKFKKCCLN